MYTTTLYLFHLMDCISLKEALFGVYVDAWILILFLAGRKLHERHERFNGSNHSEELSEAERTGNTKGKEETRGQ